MSVVIVATNWAIKNKTFVYKLDVLTLIIVLGAYIHTHTLSLSVLRFFFLFFFLNRSNKVTASASVWLLISFRVYADLKR